MSECIFELTQAIAAGVKMWAADVLIPLSSEEESFHVAFSVSAPLYVAQFLHLESSSPCTKYLCSVPENPEHLLKSPACLGTLF